MSDLVLFAILPYVSLMLFFVITIQRYRQRRFSYSSLSSQFLENKLHFWGSVPFHYGILFVLTGHAIAIVMPKVILAWNAAPLRLFILETTGLAMAILALVGLINIIVRRQTNAKAKRVTDLSDRVLYFFLGLQIATGIGVAVGHGWGSSWFSAAVTPWFWSLVTFNPDVSYIANLHWLIQVHILNAFFLVGFFPFTRLVHILVIPNPYLWRRTQVVVWNMPRP